MAEGFTGFSGATFDFLRELAAEQNRPWFEANKTRYENDVRWPMMLLVADLTSAFYPLGLPLQADPKRSVFRIHRDTRFSKDKTPYKTNIGATLTRDGSKMGPGLLYIHIEPAACFIAAGFYRPEPEKLQALRQAIADEPISWRRVVARLTEVGFVLSHDDEALTRPPRGFEHVEDDDLRHAVRRKSLTIRQPVPDEATMSSGFADVLVGFAQQAMPLLRFGWTAMGYGSAEERAAAI